MADHSEDDLRSAAGAQMMTQPMANIYPSSVRAWFTLIILLLCYTMSLLDRQILSLMVGPIRADLGISDFQVGLLQGFAFVLLFSVCALPLARIADRSNRKSLIAAGVFLWSLMTMACGIPAGFVGLFAARVGVGIGEAALGPAAHSILSDTFPREKLVRANSIYVLGALIGSGLALLVGGSVIEYVTNFRIAFPGLGGLAPWQLTFIIVGAPGIILSLVLLLFMREPTRLEDSGDPPAMTEIFRIIWRQRGEYGPLYGCGMLLGVVTYSQMNWFPTHLVRVFHLDTAQVGLAVGGMLMAGALLGTLLGPAITEFLIRKGVRAPYLQTLMLLSVLLTVGQLGPAVANLPVTLAFMFLFFLFQTSHVGPLITGIQILAPNRIRAVVVALQVLIANLAGLGFGVALVGKISDAFFASDPSGIGKAMMIVGISAAAGSALWAFIALSRSRPRLV